RDTGRHDRHEQEATRSHAGKTSPARGQIRRPPRGQRRQLHGPMNRAGDVQFQDEIVIRIAVLSVSGMALVGLATLGLIEDIGLSRRANIVAFVLYLQHELLPLLLCTTASLSLWIALKVIRPSAGIPAPIPVATVWAVALASTTLAGLGV